MIGQRIGSYRVERQLGQGGMGAVYAAVHEQLGRRAAIKVILPGLSRDPDNARRLFREARAASLVQHPGIVDTYEFGELDDGTVYIVMEYLAGESLGLRLHRGAGRPLPAALRLCRQIASALTAAHERGVVHRDLKPDNVIIVPDQDMPGGERAKLVDFGLAKMVEGGLGAPGGAGDVRTRTGMVVGTPRYMSPEQCRGLAAIGPAADVYSLGVMLYHMLAGRPPFLSESVGDVLAQHIRDLPPPLAQVCPKPVPAQQLLSLVERMLAKEPAVRPSMAEVARELDRAAASGERATVAGGPVGADSSGESELLASAMIEEVELSEEARPAAPGEASGASAQRPSEVDYGDLDAPARNRAPMVAVLLLVLAGGAGAAWLGLRGRQPPSPPAGIEVAALQDKIAGDLREQRWDEALRELEQVLGTPALPAEVRAGAALQRELAERERQAERTLMRMTAQASDKDHEGVVAAFRDFPRDSVYLSGARALYQRSFPAYAKAHLEQARAARDSGRCKEAQGQVRQILELEPAYKPAQRARGLECEDGDDSYSGPIWADLPRPALPADREARSAAVIDREAPQAPSMVSQQQPAPQQQPAQQQPAQQQQPVASPQQPAQQQPVVTPTPTPAPVHPRPVAQALPARQPTEEDRQHVLREAQGQISQGHYGAAIALVRPLTVVPSTSRTAWTVLCTAACKSGDRALALQAYSRSDADSRERLSRLCEEQGIHLEP